MIKRMMCVLLSITLLLVLSGYPNSSKETVELDANEMSLVEGLVKLEITLEYGFEPVITINDITAKGNGSDFYRKTFTVTGDYSITTSDGEVYSGDFTMDGYLESHGYSIENSDISTPTNGTNTLSPNPVFG